MKPKLYLETTIPSFLTARPSRDVVIAGQQQATRDWWNDRRQRYELYVSALVLDEASQGDAAMAAAHLEALKSFQVLTYSAEAEELTRALLTSRLIPAKAAADAAHVAVASAHGMDFLLTWNCRHIANAAIVEKLRAICIREGHAAPVICTPHELML